MIAANGQNGNALELFADMVAIGKAASAMLDGVLELVPAARATNVMDVGMALKWGLMVYSAE